MLYRGSWLWNDILPIAAGALENRIFVIENAIFPRYCNGAGVQPLD
jgi:hypothetical protein